jgi:RNA recognition motif-containing protein
LGAGQSAREVTVASSRIQVTNFDKSTTEEELKELFIVHGRVRQVEIVSVKKAVLALDGSEFKGATLKVQEARPFHDSDRRRNRRR